MNSLIALKILDLSLLAGVFFEKLAYQTENLFIKRIFQMFPIRRFFVEFAYQTDFRSFLLDGFSIFPIRRIFRSFLLDDFFRPICLLDGKCLPTGRILFDLSNQAIFRRICLLDGFQAIFRQICLLDGKFLPIRLFFDFLSSLPIRRLFDFFVEFAYQKVFFVQCAYQTVFFDFFRPICLLDERNSLYFQKKH